MTTPINYKLIQDTNQIKLEDLTDIKKESIIINRELEGGLEQILEVNLPALIAVQTGINEPRYVSIMAIRRARKKEIKVMNLADIGLKEDDVGKKGSWINTEEMFLPPIEKETELLTGSPDEIVSSIIEIFKDRGFV